MQIYMKLLLFSPTSLSLNINMASTSALHYGFLELMTCTGQTSFKYHYDPVCPYIISY